MGVETSLITQLYDPISLYLTTTDIVSSEDFDHVLWLKAVSLKGNIIVWRLFLNWLATKDFLCRWHILEETQSFCSTSCSEIEDKNHLFFKCDFYGNRWLLISGFLGVSTVLHGNLLVHSIQFGGFGGCSKNSQLAFNIFEFRCFLLFEKIVPARFFTIRRNIFFLIKMKSIVWVRRNDRFFIVRRLDYCVTNMHSIVPLERAN